MLSSVCFNVLLAASTDLQPPGNSLHDVNKAKRYIAKVTTKALFAKAKAYSFKQ